MLERFDGNKFELSDKEWRKKLTTEEYYILRNKGTERPFCEAYYNFPSEPGIFVCKGCGLPLFSSDGKFTSLSGWPSFFVPIYPENITYKEDLSYGMERTEILCSRCDSHLGHVFPDGPPPSGNRYCVNSLTLTFLPEK